jgi:hypothetical protein
MTGQRGEGAAADPSGAHPGKPDDLDGTADRVRAALAEMFGRIAPIGAAFAAQRRGCLAAGTELTPDRLTGVREIIWRQLSLLPAAAGADIRMSQLEPVLLAILRSLAAPAVLVTAERRVLAANTPRWIPGTRLDRLPSPGEAEFTAVTDIGADSGWLLAAARA